MKKGIHPEYKETTIVCGCGEKIVTRSTKQNITLGICSKCHPFFTGKQKFVDTAGRVEKFQRRYGWSDEKADSMSGKKKSEAAEAPKAPAESSQK